MIISKAEIKNFRSLKHLAVPELTATTIFYGDNNAGKSNLLGALYLIFKRKPSSENIADPVNFYDGVLSLPESDYYNNDTSQNIVFNVEVKVERTELDIDAIVASVFKEDGEITFRFQGHFRYDLGTSLSEINLDEIFVDETRVYGSKPDGVDYFPSLDEQLVRQGEFSKPFGRVINAFNDCVYIVGSDRDMLESDFVNDKITDLTPATFKRYLHSLYLSTKDYPLFEAINDTFSKEPFSFGDLSFASDGTRLEIMVKEKEFRLPIKNLGSGVLQTLYIITSIVRSKSKIVCLEELEQNLSPKKQYQILRKIKTMIGAEHTALTQIILTSHSSVYSKPKLGTIYFLEKKDGQTAIKEKENEGKRSNDLKEHFAPTEENYDEYIQKVAKETDLDFGT